MRTAPEIVSMMRAVAPPGQPGLDQATMDRLSELTRALRAAVPSAAAEYARFLAIGGRSLPLPGAALDAWLGGKSVLVTGGTGCIGARLLQLLAGRGPRRLVSLSRGVTGPLAAAARRRVRPGRHPGPVPAQRGLRRGPPRCRVPPGRPA